MTTTDERVREYVTPVHVLWKADESTGSIENEDYLLEDKGGQISLQPHHACVMRNTGGRAGLLLDFGAELHGGIELLTWRCGKEKTARLRIRFGESAMEAMSEIGEKNSTNDHAVRDMTVEVGFLGSAETGSTGFRFVRIDLLGEGSFLELKSVRAVSLYRKKEYLGSFRCNDPLINEIWETGARTVHLNMQNYLWDGIKRDRLVWVGDLYPEISVVGTVFGFDQSVPRSLDFIRDETPLPEWMNGLPSYSMWWIMNHYRWNRQNGNLGYLKEQKYYLLPLLKRLEGFVNGSGFYPPENLFVDWSSVGNKQAQESIFLSLLILSLEAGAELCMLLEEEKAAAEAWVAVKKARLYSVNYGGSKQAAAMMVLAGLADPSEINRRVLSVGGAVGLSAFMGYFVLEAKAKARDVSGALSLLREYWGGMLEMGATSFWEEFDVDWMENATRIDELVPSGKTDIHGDTGAHCYQGYRKSLCHGWAAGPTAWLSEHVLGIKLSRAGCLKVGLEPELGDLSWAEGSYPTPQGVIKVRHERKPDGTIGSQLDIPKEITVAGR